MKVIFIHKQTGLYVGGALFDQSYWKEEMIKKGVSKDRADMLSDIIGPYSCVWVIDNGEDPYEAMRDRLKDKASYLDGEDLIMKECDDYDYDDDEEEEDEEDGEID